VIEKQTGTDFIYLAGCTKDKNLLADGSYDQSCFVAKYYHDTLSIYGYDEDDERS